ncbi:hypothetical protein Hanom_Chr09g00795731 [Helianthus anomalus]
MVATRRLDQSRRWEEQTEGRHSSKPRNLKSSGPCLVGCTGFAVGLCSGSWVLRGHQTGVGMDACL